MRSLGSITAFTFRCVGAAAATGLLLAACSSTPPGGAPELPSTGEAFEGVQCSAVRPQTEPDLMGWDPGSRANLDRLRRQGVVAVRYVSEGCNVELELLSNCIGEGSYSYAPYSARRRKIAHDAQELFTELPIGAARLNAKVKGENALRTDYMLAGTLSLAAGRTYHADDLRGPACDRATHVITTIYLGGFAMVAGKAQTVEGGVSVFGAGLGAGATSELERLDREGQPDACLESQKTGEQSPQCSVPLRIGLLELRGLEKKEPEEPVRAPASEVAEGTDPERCSRPESVTESLRIHPCESNADCCSDEYCAESCGDARRSVPARSLLAQEAIPPTAQQPSPKDCQRLCKER